MEGRDNESLLRAEHKTAQWDYAKVPSQVDGPIAIDQVISCSVRPCVETKVHLFILVLKYAFFFFFSEF